MTDSAGLKLKVYLMASPPILEYGIRVLLERADLDVLSIPQAESAFRNAAVWSSRGSNVILKTLSNNALHELSEMRARFPRMSIVVFNLTEPLHDLVMPRNLGVRAYLGPTSTPAELVDAIRRVAQGKDLLRRPPRVELGGEATDQETRQGQSATNYGLTEREMEILHLVCQEATNRDVQYLCSFISGR